MDRGGMGCRLVRGRDVSRDVSRSGVRRSSMRRRSLRCRVKAHRVLHRSGRRGVRRLVIDRLGRLDFRNVVVMIVIPQEIRPRHGRTRIERRRYGELRQRASYIELRRVAHGDGVHLPRGYQAAQHFAHLAAGGQRSQEHLHLFHAGGDDGLQVDGGEHGDGGDL